MTLSHILRVVHTGGSGGDDNVTNRDVSRANGGGGGGN